MSLPAICDFDNDAMTCPRCGFKAGGRDWKKNCAKSPQITTSCIHLGSELRRVDCQDCQGTVRLKVFACAIHGQCTLRKRLDGVKCCAACGDYAVIRSAAVNLVRG
jgi:hypothetical protein